MRQLALCLTLAATAGAAQDAGFLDAPPGATACTGCHATGSDMPLAGLTAEEIATATLAFRSGEREGTLMNRIAAGFDDAEIQAIATWLASRTDP